MAISRRKLLAGAGAGAAMLGTKISPTRAQSQYPSRPLHVICGYPPGVTPDIIVRYFSERLKILMGQPVIVENKPGAATTIATEYVARSKPDGYTLFINGGNVMAANVYQYKNSRDPLKDFSPVAPLIRIPHVVCVSGQSAFDSAVKFLEMIKAKGDKASYGTAGGSSAAAGELLRARANLSVVQVNYKATADGLNDLNGGHIDYIMTDPTFAIPQRRAGNLKILAVTSATRSEIDLTIPTLQESGVPNYDVEAWMGAFFPADTPQDIVERMAAWLNQIQADPESKEMFTTTLPITLFPGTPESLRQFMSTEIPKWAEMLKIAKIEPQ